MRLDDVYIPSSPNQVAALDENPNKSVIVDDGYEGMILFDKRYDVLRHPAWNLSNELNGTCQSGQLLLRGYQQMIINGKHLREAYLFDSKVRSDPRMRLIDVQEETPWERVYYRADDDQRTVMSGQVLLRGLFEDRVVQDYVNKHNRYPILPLRIADRHRDVLDPEERICPRLAEIRERFESTIEYRRFTESLQVQILRNFQQDVLGKEMDDGIDCLMTTMCTDRPLPVALDDYQGGDEDYGLGDESPSASANQYGTNLFLRLYNYFVKRYTILATYNNAEYSKLAMGPLWVEIMENIDATMHEDDTICCPKRMTPSLAIFSGHDTTIIPLLASLPNAYDNKWPSYASMVVIEIHEINIDGRKNPSLFPSEYAFRLIYNGRSLTHLIKGCPLGSADEPNDMCDISVLQNHTRPIATQQRACARQHAVPTEYHGASVNTATEFLSSQLGVAVILLLVLSSAAMGSFLTLLYLRNTPAITDVRRQRRKYEAAPVFEIGNDDEEDGGDGIRLTRLGGAQVTNGTNGIHHNADSSVESMTLS